jgi:pyridoxal phosphate enzyme (YggS family)
VKNSSGGKDFRGWRALSLPRSPRADREPSVPSDPLHTEIAAARQAVLDRIAAAARAAGRDPAGVSLVAVSKQQPDERIAAMLAAGQRTFGENRVQEAQARWANRRQGVELRLIGPLQTNKAREAVALFDIIETLDREKLARVLAEEMAKAGKTVRLYVQVNTGEEPQKAGVTPADADAFIAACRDAYGLTIEGLMCIPPEAEPAGPHFALLAKIAARNALSKLSMGMSNDYETAVRFGATSVRVGSALFGARPA